MSQKVKKVFCVFRRRVFEPESKFMQQLDHHSSQLTNIFKRKGGAAGRKIRNIMANLDKVVFFLFISDNKDKPAGHHGAENWPSVYRCIPYSTQL